MVSKWKRADGTVIPAMTPDYVHDVLTEIGRGWAGRGVAIELGGWLGASSAALATGLVEAGYDRDLHVYDRWIASEAEVIKAARCGIHLELRQDLEPLFRANVSAIYAKLHTHRGSIHKAQWLYGPIEIYLQDAVKSGQAWLDVIAAFGPHWIPGAMIGLLDYHFYRKRQGRMREKFEVPRHFVEAYAPYFECIAEWPDKCDSAFFRYRGGLPW